jgi:L-ascorbate metabolism protein UlaG (beta-lactamase superfamily)
MIVAKVAKAAGAILLTVLALAAAFVVAQAQRHPDLTPYADMTLSQAPTSASIRVRFAGVSTLLFDDGETAFLTDGFFSRPELTSVLFSKIAPNEQAIDAGLANLGVKRLAAVVVMHGHYDHAMDSSMVARKTGALLVGDESVMNVGRGSSTPEAAMRRIGSGDAISLGKWRLTFIPSRHAPTPFSDGAAGERIDKPLKLPAHATAWREGETWSLLVEHISGRSYLVQGSAGFVEGALRGRKAEVVFLGVGAAGKQSADYRANLWAEVPAAVGAKRVILVHWDDFWRGLDRPLRPMPYLADDFGATLRDLSRLASRDGVDLRLPMLFVPFDPSP